MELNMMNKLTHGDSFSPLYWHFCQGILVWIVPDTHSVPELNNNLINVTKGMHYFIPCGKGVSYVCVFVCMLGARQGREVVISNYSN